jgi:hypothetical protein
MPRVTDNDTIALFPQEWIRDPASSFLRSAYHDIPWEEPELIRDCVGNSRKQSAWYSRANWNKTSISVRTPKLMQVSAESYDVGTRLGGD